MKKTKTTIVAMLFLIMLTATLLFSAIIIQPISATPADYLTTGGSGVASWSNAKPKFGDWSVKLYLPSDFVVADEARVVLPYSGTLGSVESVSYWYYIAAGACQGSKAESNVWKGNLTTGWTDPEDGYIAPFLVLAVDTIGDDKADSWVVEFGWIDEKETWKKWTVNNDTLVHVAGLRTGLAPDKFLTVPGVPGTLSALKEVTGWADYPVLEVKVMIGEFVAPSQVSTEAVTDYVDDITINGVLYPLEPIVLDKEYYHTGGTVKVTVADAYANLDPMAIDEVAVTAVSLTDTTGDTITLKETGAGNTGIFVGYVHLIGTPPADRAADEIVVSAEDKITVTYESLTDTAFVNDVAPVVKITAPTADAFVAGEAVSITATITEEHPGTASILIDGVEVKSDGYKILPYSWNTTVYDDGVHTIKVVATDMIGNVGSDLISVNVDNTAPSVTNPAASPSVIIPERATDVILTASVSDDVILGVTGSGVDTVTVDCTQVGKGAVTMLDDGAAPDETPRDGIYTARIMGVTVAVEGLYNLTVTATDVKGNVNATEKIVLTGLMDVDPPVFVSTEVEYPIGAVSARLGDRVVISVVVTDVLSGVESVTIDATEIGLGASEAMVRIAGTDTWTKDLIVGSADPGTKTLTIKALDLAVNDNSTIVQVEVTLTLTAYNIQLVEGWNLISLPLIPDDPSITVVLADIVANVDKVWAYDAATETWFMYSPAAPEISDLWTMVDGKGYWINMTAAATLTIHGVEVPLPPETPHRYKVVPGWNLIGYKEIDPMSAADYLAGIAGKYVTIYEFVDGVFHRITATDNMVPGRGYWIAVTEEGYIYP